MDDAKGTLAALRTPSDKACEHDYEEITRYPINHLGKKILIKEMECKWCGHGHNVRELMGDMRGRNRRDHI